MERKTSVSGIPNLNKDWVFLFVLGIDILRKD